MSKHKKKKKGNKLLNKKEFVNTICKQECGICKSPTPAFCFNEIYIDRPNKFREEIVPKLKELKDAFTECDMSLANMNEEEFSAIFCNTHICPYSEFNKCSIIEACLTTFVCQENNKFASLVASSCRKKNISVSTSKARKVKIAPIPTFFTRDRPELLNELKSIIQEGI